MKDAVASEGFVNELRRVLQHLYNPAELRKSPMLEILNIHTRRTPLATLRRILTDAILALKPGPDVPPHASTWRYYHILMYRYVEQSSQKQVAADLALSIRQLRRQEQAAVQVLADYLWGHCGLKHQTCPPFTAFSQTGQQPTLKDGVPPDQEQELEWLKKSFPSEIADIDQVTRAALRIIEPLTQELNVQVKCNVPCGLPPVIGQLITIRHALLNVLTAAIHSAPDGQVRVAVETDQRGLCVHVQATTASPISPQNDGFDKLDMARQLIGLFGGILETPSAQSEKQRFAVTLVLSIAERSTVLVIDDNADTLQLFKRYLSSSRYRFIGIHDPEQALTLAEEFTPQIIVLDVMLPNIDGWELLERLREHPKTQNIPIIVSTILPQERLALTLGAAAFLHKPVSRKALLSALDDQMDSLAKESP